MITHRKSDLKWTRLENEYFLTDETRSFSNLGYVEGFEDLYVAYVYEPLTRTTFRELGFYDNAYDAKRAVEGQIPDFYM